MRRSIIIFPAMLFFAIAASAQTPLATATPYTRPDAKARFKLFVNDTVGPMSWAGRIAGAGFSTATNSPKEWQGTWNGFGKRLASNFGKSVIRNSVIYGLDEALKLDSKYYRSEKRTVSARIRNAVISPFTARKANGKRTVGVPRIVGTYTASIIANETWYPARFTWKDGVRTASVSFGTAALFNLVKEFVTRR